MFGVSFGAGSSLIGKQTQQTEEVVAYRNDLEAAQGRIAELEGENQELKKITAPSRAIWRTVFALLAVSLTALTGGIYIALDAKSTYDDESRTAVESMRERTSKLRNEAVALRAQHDALTRETSLLQRRVEIQHDDADGQLYRIRERNERERVILQQELDGLRAQIVEASGGVALTADIPGRTPHRLTEMQIAARLTHCVPYGSGNSEEYPYAEGVVISRYARIIGTSDDAGHFFVRDVVQRMVVRVRGQSDVTIETRGTKDVLVEYGFWDRLEVGDIVGISWHEVRFHGRSVVALRTTVK